MLSRTTSHQITALAPNQIFVFGSNEAGKHLGGAARFAHDQLGAEWGKAFGASGQTFAIPTVDSAVGGTLSLQTIESYVSQFIAHARNHTDKVYLVTEIGCGIAGFTPEQISPLFKEAIEVENIHLPKRFWDLLI